MIYHDDIDTRIEAFKRRIETDGRPYCESLYEYATVRLMAHKYMYYVKAKNFVDDVAYDLEERGWYVMGRALGHLKEDETSPCVDFDEKHPSAAAGIKLASRLKERSNP